MKSFGQRAAGERLERMQASPLWAGDGFRNRHPVLPGLRDPAAVRPTITDFLCGGERRVPTGPLPSVDPRAGWVYASLTNNSHRGVGGNPGVDAANPRANNVMGQIIRWRDRGDFSADTFEWNHLLLAGAPANERAEAKGRFLWYWVPDSLAEDAAAIVGDAIAFAGVSKYPARIKCATLSWHAALNAAKGDEKPITTEKPGD